MATLIIALVALYIIGSVSALCVAATFLAMSEKSPAPRDLGLVLLCTLFWPLASIIFTTRTIATLLKPSK